MILSLTAPRVALAQGQVVTSNDVVSVNISTSILSTVELITISNMNFGRMNIDAAELRLDPRTDAGAGLMKATGRPNAAIRVSFLEQRELIRVGGGSTINFTYTVAGATTDNQLTSELLTRENRTLTLSSTGEFYFWIGGYAPIENIQFGSYQGEFTIEIEYL
jgi:hypothetical protein